MGSPINNNSPVGIALFEGKIINTDNTAAFVLFLYVYYGENVPLFRRNGYRKSGTKILRVRNRDTSLK